MNDYPGMSSVYRKNRIVSRDYKIMCNLAFYRNRY
jgi:hypothetical protein